MDDIAWSAISGGSQVVRKSIEINASQNWVAPVNLAGNTVYITASGAGGAGPASSGAFYSRSGNGGEWCEKVPVIVTAGATYAVTIGAGTTGVGGTTSFGSLLTARGGSQGFSVGTATATWVFSAERATIGTHGTLLIPMGKGTGGLSDWNINAVIPIAAVLPPGRSESGSITAASEQPIGWLSGPGPGYFGASGANSGAGGDVAANGFSGKLVIEWDEFL